MKSQHVVDMLLYDLSFFVGYPIRTCIYGSSIQCVDVMLSEVGQIFHFREQFRVLRQYLLKLEGLFFC